MLINGAHSTISRELLLISKEYVLISEEHVMSSQTEVSINEYDLLASGLNATLVHEMQ